MAETRHCACFCHHAGRGDLGDARQRLRCTVEEHALRVVAREVVYRNGDDGNNVPPSVAYDDQLETLVALGCSCIMGHCSLPQPPEPRRRYLPPRPWRPEDGD